MFAHKSSRSVATLLLLFSAALHAADLYVAPTGSDTTGDGAFDTPFRTIQKAADTALPGDIVIIRAGTYRETVRPARSGTPTFPVTYRAFESDGVFEDVIISGADLVTGWTAHDTADGRAIYKTSSMSWNLSDTGAAFGTAYRNQLFVNGQMQVLARWPNVPAERITRLTYQDLALVSAASGRTGGTATSAWIENTSLHAAFPADYWSDPARATARVFLSPATMIWGMSLKIASQSANRLNLDATGSGFSFLAGYYYPAANNRFFIYDYYDALDTAGEYWKDIATNTLYLWPPAGADPSTLTVEAKRRDFGLSLDGRSHLVFEGIKLFACTVTTNSASTGLTFSEIEARYIGHIDNYAPTFTTAANAREFYLRGDGHVVRDSYFHGSAVTAIGASGTNIRVENNVIRDFGYAHHGPAILARHGPAYGNRTLATKVEFLRNTAFNAGHSVVVTDPALDVKYNRIYNSHLRGSDIGAIGIAATDGLGSEIAYNVVSDALGPKDDGVLYGGFGIYFDFECRNYTVHHNLVFNTTGSSYQLMPSRAAELPGVTDLGMKFYHNTGDGDFGIIAPHDIPGVDIRNNLVRRFLNASNGTYTSLANVQFSRNTAFGTDAAAPFRDRVHHDLRFASGSSTGVNAGTVISPFSDGFTGPAPDTGALEFDLAPFIAGATLTQRQLPSLTATSITQSGALVDIQLGNLPEGRSPPNTFQAKIGSGVFGGTLAYDYPTGTWRLLGVNKGTLTGPQIVTVRLSESGVPVTLAASINLGTRLSYEGFEYTGSTSITGLTGGTGWRAPGNPSWASGGTTGTVAASGLSYSAINPAYTTFAATGRAGNFGGIFQNNRLPAIDAGGVYANAGLKATDGNYLGGGTVNGTLWGSFLVAASSWSSPQMVFSMDSTIGTGTKVSLRQTGAGSALSLTDTSGGGLGATGSIPISALSTTTPNLIVFRYVFNGASNDTFTVWLNPTSATETPAISVTSPDFIFNILTLRSVNANGGLVFDEIRLGTGFSVVVPYVMPSALAHFRTVYGLAANGSQDLITPAGDGIATLLKYAFNMLGTGPGQAEDIDLPNAAVLAPAGSAGLPFAGVDGTGKLRLTSIRRKASSYPGITYAVEFSDALASWAVNPSATESVTSLDVTFERVTVTDSVASPAKRFARVLVSTP